MNKQQMMNLVAVCIKQRTGGKAKAGTVTKGKITQNEPDVQLNGGWVRNTRTVSRVKWQFKPLASCLLFSGTAYQQQQ